jgi:hypothetical protein
LFAPAVGAWNLDPMVRKQSLIFWYPWCRRNLGVARQLVRQKFLRQLSDARHQGGVAKSSISDRTGMFCFLDGSNFATRLSRNPIGPRPPPPPDQPPASTVVFDETVATIPVPILGSILARELSLATLPDAGCSAWVHTTPSIRLVLVLDSRPLTKACFGCSALLA